MSKRRGAAAHRDATSGQFVRVQSLGAAALAQVNQVRITEGNSKPTVLKLTSSRDACTLAR
jgi:hypothetical protein